MMTQPPSNDDEPLLAGLTVIDFTRVLAGPYCTRLLADLGARVIKIERPGEGDEIRYTKLQLDPGRTDQSSYYVRLNAGKQGIAIDLAHPDARDVVLDLVRKADVVVENFSPGVMARYGFDEAALRAREAGSRLLRHLGLRPDRAAELDAGLRASDQCHLRHDGSGARRRSPATRRRTCRRPTCSPARTPSAPSAPRWCGGPAAVVAPTSTSPCSNAWWRRTTSPFRALLNGAPVERQPRVGMVVHRIGDRHMALQTVGAPHLWGRLVALIGKPELATDARFATPAGRRENWPALLEIVRAWLDGYGSVDEAVEALSRARVPAMPMLTPEELVEHPQMAARSAFPEVAHRARGKARVTATPFHVDGRPTHPAGPAPYRVGESTRAVLTRFPRLPGRAGRGAAPGGR